FFRFSENVEIFSRSQRNARDKRVLRKVRITESHNERELVSLHTATRVVDFAFVKRPQSYDLRWFWKDYREICMLMVRLFHVSFQHGHMHCLPLASAAPGRRSEFALHILECTVILFPRSSTILVGIRSQIGAVWTRNLHGVWTDKVDDKKSVQNDVEWSGVGHCRQFACEKCRCTEACCS